MDLPIDPFLPGLVETLRHQSNFVLTAAPGAGKTTRLPAYLARCPDFAPGSCLYMIEPRRLAARASAERIATEQNWRIGHEVGYQVRYENKTQKNTRLQILTEGIFTRRLQSNPELRGVSTLILDEFHERSAATDLALAFARELQQLSRPDLKIIVMSATLQSEPLSQFLGNCPVIEVPGLLHPVQTQLSREPQNLVIGDVFYNRLLEQIRQILAGVLPSRGDLLVFLPGAGEIENLRRRLESLAQKYQLDVHALHGSLKLSEQDQVLRPGLRRRIILSTNIAETSLTLPGVGTVIDSGLVRVLRQEGLGFPRLLLTRSSRFSAVQRAGRAGREGPGFAYQMWTKMDEASRPEAETPELLRTDLSETVLLLASQGVNQPQSFSWFEIPPPNALESAQALLKNLRALHASGAITDFGQKLLRWPLHPRLATLMEAAIDCGQVEWGARLVTLLNERDLFSNSAQLMAYAANESDLLARLYLWLESPRRADFHLLNRSYEHLLQIAKSETNSPPKPSSSHSFSDDDERTEYLLLSAFADRLAKNRDDGRALLTGGSGVLLSEFCLAKRAPLLFCLDAMASRGQTGARTEMKVTLGSRLRLSTLKKYFLNEIKTEQKTFLDENSGQVLTTTFSSFRSLPLDSGTRRKATTAEAAPVLPDLVLSSWERLLAQNERAQTWLKRVEFLRENLPNEVKLSEKWPDLNEGKKQEICEALSMGEDGLEAVFQKDLKSYFEMSLTEKQKRLLNEEAPEKLQLPSGSWISVQYPKGRAPFLEARLQELFGWLETPALACGKIKLVIHLLAPNYRPVQVTSDLKGFWHSAYHEVRKELRARYPKHDWPEEPLTATASAKRGRRS